MKVIRILLFLMIISTVLISGCVNGVEKSKSTAIIIPDINDYTVLYVQGVDENGVSSESTSKFITDDNEIKAFINKVNNMKVIKPSNKEMIKKAKKLGDHGNYMFVLSDSENMDNTLYYMNFFEDGSIQFQGEDKKQIIYLSKETHPKLLEDLKNSLNIKF